MAIDRLCARGSRGADGRCLNEWRLVGAQPVQQRSRAVDVATLGLSVSDPDLRSDSGVELVQQRSLASDLSAGRQGDATEAEEPERH